MSASIEKKAMTDAEKMKYIKATLVAGIGAAGIGAIIRNMRAKKARAKAQDVVGSKNAIVIPIKKTNFMDGLPTPDELAELRGETGKGVAQIADTHSVPQLTNDVPEMTPEEISSKKQAILRANSHRFDFFGKGASAEKTEDEKNDAQTSEAKKTEPSDVVNPGGKKETRTLLRDQDGQFVSPTDPVGVAQEEKTAGSFLDTVKSIAHPIVHPVESAKTVLNAATDKPVWFTAGALGSVYLAAKLSDVINEHRRERAQKRLENARSKYIDLLEGEKQAADNGGVNGLLNGAGIAMGGAFFVPMALTAMVTNKILENRKADKKRESEMSDSYPDDPIILYKTSEDKEIPMSIESALAFMALNREIMKCAEEDCFTDGFAKVAQAVDKSIVDAMTGMLADPENNADLLAMARGHYAGNETARNAGMTNLLSRYVGIHKDMKAGNAIRVLATLPADKEAVVNALIKAHVDPNYKKALMAAVMSDPRTRATIADRFNHNAEFGKFKDEIIDNEMAHSWLGRTFKRDGWLYRGIRWLLRKTGYLDGEFNRRLDNVFAQNRNATSGIPLKSTGAVTGDHVGNVAGAASQNQTAANPMTSVVKTNQAPVTTPVAKTPLPTPSVNDAKYMPNNKPDVAKWWADYNAWRKSY